MIWIYTFEDGTRLELPESLKSYELINMVEKHGKVVVNCKEER